MYDTYGRIFTRLGLKFRAVAADSGAIGGDVSHEFHVLADSGEDAIAFSSGSDYAANVELAEAASPGARAAANEAMRKVDTPTQKTCEDVAALMGIALQRTVKSVALMGVDAEGSAGSSCSRWCAATTSSTRSSWPSSPAWASTASPPKARSIRTSAASRASSAPCLSAAPRAPPARRSTDPRHRRPQRRRHGRLRRRRQRKGLPPRRRELGPRPARAGRSRRHPQRGRRRPLARRPRHARHRARHRGRPRVPARPQVRRSDGLHCARRDRQGGDAG